jgi:lipopolysaccharide/colanic/teichoic acid biosynthesis glycosyltransferase
MKSAALKRAIDVVGAFLLLLMALLPMGAIALLVLLRMGRPVLHAAHRPGINGEPFVMYKFRTMTNDRDERGEYLPDAIRLTSLGRKLRASSLDELPELLNVLRGDMSLVGPRPLRMEYLARYTPYQARRHEVRPGITGWAQINGRNATSWEERFNLDVWYVENWNVALDLAILARTFFAVFGRQGVSAPGHATMPEFQGGEEQI